MRKKILIVEDEAALAELWKTALEHEGYSVDLAREPATVYERLEELKYDLILLDIMLPMDELRRAVPAGEQIPVSREAGVWLLERIKAKHPAMPVLVVTVVADMRIIYKIRTQGADGLIQKSDLERLDPLFSEVKRLLGETQAASSAEGQ